MYVSAIFYRHSQDPVNVLKTYQSSLIYGRKLDITDDLEPIDETGDVIPLFISRSYLLTDAMSEFLSLTDNGSDLRMPLSITFYGELAVDYGGPRKEFLQLCLREILDETVGLFQEVANGFQLTNIQNHIGNRYYFGAGLLCGKACK